MQKLMLVVFSLMYYVIWWLQSSAPKFLPYPKSNMATTHNKLTKLSSAKTKMLTLQARWLSPKAYFFAEKKPRSRNVKGKNHEWSRACRLISLKKILTDTANLPPSNLPSWRRSFLGESVKVNRQGKGKTKREVGSPDRRLASFLNKWHKLTSK